MCTRVYRLGLVNALTILVNIEKLSHVLLLTERHQCIHYMGVNCVYDKLKSFILWTWDAF